MLSIVKRYAFVILLLSTVVLQATEFDFRIGGFVPNSRLFREIYGSVIPIYQIEAAWNVPHSLQVWTNLSYITRSGESHPFNIKTRLHMIPVSIGAKYLFSLSNCTDLYFGVGLCGTWLKEKNCCNLLQTMHHVGGIFKLGATYHRECIDFLFFTDYLLQHLSGRNVQHVNASGFLFGAGIGISF